MMGQKHRRYLIPSALAWILVLAMSITLLVAAYGKLVYPIESLKKLDQGVGILEILLVLLIFCFRKKYWIWLGLAVLFACWGGYATFWYRLQLPCHCMGSLVEIPSFLSILLDALFYLLSLSLAWLLGAKKNDLVLFFFVSCLAYLLGYACAEWVYRNFILAYPQTTSRWLGRRFS
jgi:hypothetical protein